MQAGVGSVERRKKITIESIREWIRKKKVEKEKVGKKEKLYLLNLSILYKSHYKL